MEVTASAFGEYRKSNQVPVMCAVTWLCVLEAPPTAVFRPSYNRRGKPWVRHSTPCESLLSVFIDWGMNENTHTRAHTQVRPSSVGVPALFKHSLLCHFLTCVKRRKSCVLSPSTAWQTFNTDYDFSNTLIIHIYIQVQLCKLQCVARV